MYHNLNGFLQLSPKEIISLQHEYRTRRRRYQLNMWHNRVRVRLAFYFNLRQLLCILTSTSL